MGSLTLAMLARDVAKAERLGRAAREAGKRARANPWPCEARGLAGMREARLGIAWLDGWQRADRKARRKARKRAKRAKRHTRVARRQVRKVAVH